jgi:hypothetical protein
MTLFQTNQPSRTKMDINKLKELMANKKASMRRVERTAKINPGKNRIRVLPGWRVGEEHQWFHDFGQHYIKDATDTIQAVYMCSAKTFDTECEVCNAIVAAGRCITDDETQAVLEKSKPSHNILINALMLDSTEPNTPVILEIKRSVFSQLSEILTEWGPEIFFDAEKGQEIVILRDGKGLGTTYTAQITPKKYSIPPASLSRLNNLDEYVKQDSDDQERRAIGAVNSVAGLTHRPAATTPALSRDVPHTALPSPAAKPKADDVAIKSRLAPRASVALDSELDELDDLLGLPD